MSEEVDDEDLPPPPAKPAFSPPAASAPAKGRTPAPPPPADDPLPPRPSGGPTIVNTKKGQMILPESRNIQNVPRVKKWIDAAHTVQQQEIDVKDEEASRKVIEGFSADAVRTAASRAEAFSQAALAEEKMYLLWFNRQLKALGKPEVNNISDSLQDGILIMEVLKKLSGENPPQYAKRVTVIQQAVDNWHVIVKFMGRLGIQVDNAPDRGDAESVGLDPVSLHSLDRREILKLFSKLLIYESQ